MKEESCLIGKQENEGKVSRLYLVVFIVSAFLSCFYLLECVELVVLELPSDWFYGYEEFDDSLFEFGFGDSWFGFLFFQFLCMFSLLYIIKDLGFFSSFK